VVAWNPSADAPTFRLRRPPRSVASTPSYPPLLKVIGLSAAPRSYFFFHRPVSLIVFPPGLAAGPVDPESFFPSVQLCWQAFLSRPRVSFDYNYFGRRCCPPPEGIFPPPSLFCLLFFKKPEFSPPPPVMHSSSLFLFPCFQGVQLVLPPPAPPCLFFFFFLAPFRLL